MRALRLLLFLATTAFAQDLNTVVPGFGVYIGSFDDAMDGAIKGKVFVVNETTLQIVNFTFSGDKKDAYFWVDAEKPTPNGLKVPTFEYGITPLKEYNGQDRVVLRLPNLHKIADYKGLFVYDLKDQHNLGGVAIPDGISALMPKEQFLSSELKGSRYNVGSGPILIKDPRTIVVYGFKFDADKAPDSYFFVGKGPTVAHDAGVKIPIRGKDTANSITAMSERYRGGKDIILDLPEGMDIHEFEWLSVYCYKFRVDFGHVSLKDVSHKIPPFVATPKTFEDELIGTKAWPAVSLLGTDSRRNFTFQLGVPGGNRGYGSMTKLRPSEYVWYVNGLLADIYLKRDVTYTFIVEGGMEKGLSQLSNPLYLSSDPNGGYGKLSTQEKSAIKIYSGDHPDSVVGRMCYWQNSAGVDPENYATFMEFRKELKLDCEEGKPSGVMKFTPTKDTPDTLYYQSFAEYNMGWKIHIVDELPTTIADLKEEPYQFHEWRAIHDAQKKTNDGNAVSVLVSTVAALLTLALFN